MPRAYLGPKDKANAKRAEAFNELFGVVEKYTYMRNYDATDLMKVVGFSRTVYYDRRKLPERLRFGELMNLIQTLKIPYSEIEPLMQVILSF